MKLKSQRLALSLLVQQQLETRLMKSDFTDFTPTPEQLVLYEKKMKSLADTGASETSWHATVTIDGERVVNTGIDHKAYLVLRNMPGSWSSEEKHRLMRPFIARNILVKKIEEMITEVRTRLWEEEKSLATLSKEELITEISRCRLGNRQMGVAYYLLGEKYWEDHDLDRSLKAYTTAATRYYDPLSMIKLSNIHYWGSEAIKNDRPNLKARRRIPADREKAYFWVMSAFQIDSVRKRDAVYYGIMLLDMLGYDDSFEKRDAEKEMWHFLTKRYPQIFDRYNIKAHF